jgi:Ca2+-transporting ATPase
LALATDPVDPAVLSRRPRSPDAELMDRGFVKRVVFTGCLSATVTLAAFAYELAIGGSVAAARSAAFFVLVTDELLRSFGARSSTKTIRAIGLLSNLRLLAVAAVSFALQLCIHDMPALQAIFETESISLARSLTWFALASVPVLVLELLKVRARAEAGASSRWAAAPHGGEVLK